MAERRSSRSTTVASSKASDGLQSSHEQVTVHEGTSNNVGGRGRGSGPRRGRGAGAGRGRGTTRGAGQARSRSRSPLAGDQAQPTEGSQNTGAARGRARANTRGRTTRSQVTVRGEGNSMYDPQLVRKSLYAVYNSVEGV